MSEVKALLLTDVVDSTGLSEQIGDEAMARLWAAHDRAARDLLPVWRGREIDKSDGLLLLFDSAADAVGYAAAYHGALSRLGTSLKARAGVHVGPVVLRANPPADVAQGAKPLEVEGVAKLIAARAMALAQGCQTLVTASARDALGDLGSDLPSVGHWRMKGIAEPIELFVAGQAASTPGMPPDGEKGHRVARVGDRWLPIRSIPNNLPHEVSSFVGRQAELAEVCRQLRATRLLTLCGVGGLGKTRAALQVAARTLPDFPDGAWFVDLAPIGEGDLVCSAVTAALGVVEQPGVARLEALLAHVAEKRLLLVLDNCEHLLGACAAVADQLLRRAPGITVLATSRERLHIGGEQVRWLHPLAVPSTEASTDMDELMQCESVRLFVDRASQTRPGFSVPGDQLPALADLCRRLDGIPLAIELAAARVASIDVQQIAGRLDDRFRLLAGGSRAALPRQQTLRALLDWSHDLLDDAERRLFERLSVFAGGWALESAEVVCVAAGVEPDDVLDLMSALVEKSLVLADPSARRYRMLETVRQYASDRLARSADRTACEDRYIDHWIDVAERAEPHLEGHDQRAWLLRLRTEGDNLRAALALCAERTDRVDDGIRLAGALWRYWFQCGLADEGRRCLTRLLACTTADDPASLARRAKAASGCACLAIWQSDYDAAEAIENGAMQIRERLGDRRGIATSSSHLATCALFRGDHDTAQRLYEDSLAIARELGDRHLLANVLVNLGSLAYRRGALGDAGTWYAEALHLKRELDDGRGVGELLAGLGLVACDQGAFLDARRLFEEGLALQRSRGDASGEALSMLNLGLVCERLAEWDAARGLYRQSLAIWQEEGARANVAQCLNNLGAVDCETGDLASARAHHVEALAIRQSIGDKHGLTESLRNLGCLALRQGEAAEAAAFYRDSLALAHELGNPRSVASALVGLADAESLRGSAARAACLWAVASRVRSTCGYVLSPFEQQRHQEQVTRTRIACCDDDAFDAAWRAGAALSQEAAMALALEGHRVATVVRDPVP